MVQEFLDLYHDDLMVISCFFWEMVAIIVQFSPAVAFLYDHSPQGLGIFAICFMTCDVYQVFI